MKLIKFLLGTVAVIVIPLLAIVMADDCFDTVIDENGKTYYIDPFDKWSVFEKKESLINIYGDEIKCTGGKKVYSQEEYFNEIYDNLQKQSKTQEKKSGGGSGLIELVMLILGCVALRKIFVKAGKPGINSIIPVYNMYELSDIAGLSGMFGKAFACFVLGILVFLFIPKLGLLLIVIFVIYGFVVNFYVARNFGWSTVASILYVIFNPIAMLILAFGNDKYYITTGQKEEIKEIAKKVQMDEIMGKSQPGNINNNANNITPEKVDEDFEIDNNISQTNNSGTEEDPIKYIDPSNFE